MGRYTFDGRGINDATDPYRRRIATLRRGDDAEDQARLDADARLFAAADVMHEALQDAAAWLACLDDLTENEEATMQSITAALAKAEGRG